MYFYLYGTKEQKHVEHMLASSSNAQLTSDQVDLKPGGDALSEADLAKSLILRLDNVHENIFYRCCHPTHHPSSRQERNSRSRSSGIRMPPMHSERGIVRPGQGYVYTPIASGTMALSKFIYTDSILLNGNPALDGTLEAEEGVSGKTLEERVNATRRCFVGEDPKNVDWYYKQRDAGLPASLLGAKLVGHWVRYRRR